MAELLIYTEGNHKRYEKGDVVETREDGYWGEPNEKNKHGWNHKVFALIKLTDVSVEEVQHLVRPKVKLIGYAGRYPVWEETRKREFKIDNLTIEKGRIETKQVLTDLIITKKEHPTVG